MPYGTLAVDTVQSSTAGTPPQFNDGNSTQVGTLCRAWVNFNGTSANPITPRANFNVSSVTKNGTGNYTLNFTNALPDANYAAVFGGGANTASSDVIVQEGYGASPVRSTTQLKVFSVNAAFTYYDAAFVSVSVFR